MTEKESESGIEHFDSSKISPDADRSRYERLVNSIEGIVWEAEADPFKFTFVNKTAEKILGYPVSQWLAEPDFWINHLHPVDREWAIGFCLNAVKRREDHQIEYRMIAADGSIVWLRDNVTVDKENGRFLQGLMVNITERIEAMDNLRASEDRIRLLIEQMPAIVWSTDRDLRFTHMAGRALTLLNVPEGRNVGVSLQDYFQSDDPDFKPIVAHRRALRGESLTYVIDWMGYIFDAYVEPLRNAVGEIVGCVGIAMDVTRRKLAEDNMLKEKRLTEAMFESLPGIFYLFTKEGKYLRWNRYFESVTGRSAKEIAAMSPVANIPDEEKPLALQRIEEVFTQGQATLEANIVTSDGTPIPYFFTGKRVTVDQEPCLIGMGIDITDRKRVEDENRKLIHLLGERVKELTMLHKTARILQDERRSVPELLRGIVDLMPPAWQYPEITEARIRFGEVSSETGRFAPSPWLQKAEFEVAGVHGTIEVVYLEERRDEDEGPFLLEERSLIDSLSEMICFALDRLRVQDELRESQRRFSDTLTNLQMIAVMTDTEGNIMFSNDYLLRLTDWKREEVMGQNWFDMFIPAHEKEKVERLLVESSPEGKIVPHFENEIKTRSGERRVVKWTNTTLRDLNGQIAGIAALGNDVTEREHFERELIKSEERYRDLVENALDIIYTHDLEGNYTSMNKAGEQISGYSREEILKMNVAQIAAPEFVDKVRQMIASKVTGADETVYNLEILAKDGRRIAVEVNTRLILHDGVPVGVQGIARDVTERRNLEEQLLQAQKMEAVGRLAGGIAHDFNNMLTAINGYSDLSLRRLLPGDPIRANIEEIKKAGERSAALTQQLLAFSRKQVMQPRILDLNGVISETESLLRRLIGEDVELETRLAAKLGSVKADPGQIEQVIMNLVINARDAMPRGGKVVVETANVSLDEEAAEHIFPGHPGNYVTLSVSDTGTGMDEETQKHIFEPFFTTKEVGKGTGLGLATVYGIINQSEGNVRVESKPGQGTAFRIYLPRVSESAQKYERGPETDISLKGAETILLVEDEDVVRNLTHEALENYGYTVLEAIDGESASSISESHEGLIHLLITDVIMPGVSGPGVAGDLYRKHPEMKVLYISGYTDDAIADQGILAPGINFLQKPFTPEALGRKVREVLTGVKDKHRSS